MPANTPSPNGTAERLNDVVACPACKSENIGIREDRYVCDACGNSYAIVDDVPAFIPPGSPVLNDEAERAEFWNAGWERRTADWLDMSPAELGQLRDELIDQLRKEAYPSVTDLGPDTARGRTLLNIGCGGGMEGMIFAGYGARYIGVDIAARAAKYTLELVRKLGYAAATVQAEAEHLPVRGNCIDIVYSNGVLHHTPKIQDALAEVHRVLKPHATAIIGLYATHSIHFYVYRIHALLAGCFTTGAYKNWLDANTELEWKTSDRVNQWTESYTRKQFAALLRGAGFSKFRLQQNHIQVQELPVLGKRIAKLFPDSLATRKLFRFGGMLIATCTKD